MLILSFISQLFSIHVFSQTQDIQKADETSTKSLLWKISGKELKKPSYVFGTIHAICTSDYFFTKPMQTALNNSKQLILEVNLNDPAIAQEYQTHMTLPEGTELKNYFSNEDEYRQFAERLQSYTDMDISLFSKFKPLVLLSALSMKSFACSATSSYETNLMDLAKAAHIPIRGLETALSQFEIFDHLTNEEIKELLFEGLEESRPEKGNKEEQMMVLYKNQDIDGLYNLLSSSKELKGHEQEFLINRNINWVKDLPKLMDEKPCFIAVGAAHLAGESGILNLLAKEGYRVEPITK